MYHDVLFPPDISQGSRGGPGFDTYILELDSGREERVARRQTARHRYDVSKGLRKFEDLTTLKAFYLARQGPANSFPYKDWQDWHSNPTDSSFMSTPGTQDQLIGTGDGSQTVFQLIKKYTSGLVAYTRNITKPVNDGSIRVWVDGVLQTEGVHYTVNYQTGQITFNTAPPAGDNVHASFYFYVPVRFGEELDEALSISMRNWGSGGVSSIPLVEDLDPDPGYADEFFYGGAVEKSIDVSIQIDTTSRVWEVAASTTGMSVQLPDPTNMATGGPWFLIKNNGANSFTVTDHTAASLVSLGAGQMVEVWLAVDSGGNKVWIVG